MVYIQQVYTSYDKGNGTVGFDDHIALCVSHAVYHDGNIGDFSRCVVDDSLAGHSDSGVFGRCPAIVGIGDWVINASFKPGADCRLRASFICFQSHSFDININTGGIKDKVFIRLTQVVTVNDKDNFTVRLNGHMALRIGHAIHNQGNTGDLSLIRLRAAIVIAQINAGMHLLTGCVAIHDLKIFTSYKLHNTIGIIPGCRCIGGINIPAVTITNIGIDIRCVLQGKFASQLIKIGADNGIKDCAVRLNGHIALGVGYTVHGDDKTGDACSVFCCKDRKRQQECHHAQS